MYYVLIYLFRQKTGWASVWPAFSQTHLVTLLTILLVFAKILSQHWFLRKTPFLTLSRQKSTPGVNVVITFLA
jgi:hypothetical protein